MRQGGEMPVQLEGIHAAAPNLCCVCVDGTEAGECRGRLFHYYTNGAQPFRSWCELIIKIDALCDMLGYPQAAEQPRRFGRGTLPKAEKKEVTKLKSKDDLVKENGELATFVVHVMHRQNATWQGTVVWAEKSQKASFRSVLELVKLMDSAMEDTLSPNASPDLLPENGAGNVQE